MRQRAVIIDGGHRAMAETGSFISRKERERERERRGSIQIQTELSADGAGSWPGSV